MSPATLSQIPFRKAVWLLPLAWTLHEAEEWNILDWYHAYWVKVPEATPTEMRVGLAFMSLVGVGWTAFTLLPKKPKLTAFLLLPFFTLMAAGNAVQHVYWTVAFQAYSPGVVTAVFLVIPSIVYLTARAVRENLIPRWYGLVIYLPIVRSLREAVLAGNVVPEPVHGLMKLFATMARFLGL